MSSLYRFSFADESFIHFCNRCLMRNPADSSKFMGTFMGLPPINVITT